MYGRDLSFYRPLTGTSAHVAQLISCFGRWPVYENPLRSTIKELRVQPFRVTFLFAAIHVTHPLIVRLRNGAVKPSHVGRSPLPCKFAPTKPVGMYHVFPRLMKIRMELVLL